MAKSKASRVDDGFKELTDEDIYEKVVQHPSYPKMNVARVFPLVAKELEKEGYRSPKTGRPLGMHSIRVRYFAHKQSTEAKVHERIMATGNQAQDTLDKLRAMLKTKGTAEQKLQMIAIFLGVDL